MTTSAPDGWTVFSNHGHVLIFVATNPQARIRDIAAAVGITERRAQAIVSELVEVGFLSVTKNGRRNTYSVHPEARLRHPAESQHTIGEVISLFQEN